MSDYKDEWGRIDELALTPGGTDRAPMDVWLEHRLRANLRALTAGLDAVACPIVCGERTFDDPPASDAPYPGDQAWASYGWHCPISVPIVVPQGCTAVRLILWCAVLGGASAQVSWRLELANDVAGQDVLTRDSGVITKQNLEEMTTQLEVELPSPQAQTRPQILRLWVRSNETTTGTEVNAGATLPRQLFFGASVTLPNVGSRPTSTTLDVTAAEMLDVSGETIAVSEIVGVDPTDNTVATSVQVGEVESFVPRHLSVLQCRSASVQMVFDPDSLGAPPRVGLQAQTPVRGRLAMRTAWGRERYWNRPRLAAWGPGGYSYDAGGDVGVSRRRWRWTMGDDTTALDKKIIDAPLFVRRDDATLVVHVLLASCYHGGLNAERDTGSVGKREVVEDALITWDLDADVSRGGTSIESTAQSVEARTWSTSLSIVPGFETFFSPLLTQRGFEKMEIPSTSFRANRLYAVGEGRLFDSDFLTLTHAEIEIDVSSVADIDEHVRLSVSAEAGSATFDLVKGRAELVCVGWSATLVP